MNDRVILVDTSGNLYSTNGEQALTRMLPFEDFSDFLSPQFLNDVEGPPFLEFNGYLYIATANYVLYTNGTHTYTLSGSQSYIYAHNFVVVNDDTLCFFAQTEGPVPGLFCGNGTHAELVDVQWPPDGVLSSTTIRRGLVTEWNGRVVVGVYASTGEVVPLVLVFSAAATASFRTFVWATATVWATLWAFS